MDLERLRLEEGSPAIPVPPHRPSKREQRMSDQGLGSDRKESQWLRLRSASLQRRSSLNISRGSTVRPRQRWFL